MLIQNLFKQKTTNSSQQLNSWIQNEDKNITAKYRHEYEKEGEWYDSSEIWSSKNRNMMRDLEYPTSTASYMWIHILWILNLRQKSYQKYSTYDIPPTQSTAATYFVCHRQVFNKNAILLNMRFLFLFPIFYTFDIVVLCIENKW